MRTIIVIAAFATLFPAAAGTASAAPRNLNEYLKENLPQESGALLRAVSEKFADYALESLSGRKQDAAKEVLAVLASICQGQDPARAAAVAFAAYRGISRGADVAFVDAVVRHGCDAGLDADTLSGWASGFAQMTSNKVPPEVAVELVLLADEGHWTWDTFNIVKWGLAHGGKKGYSPKKYAGYIFAKLRQDASAPGRTVADAQALFAKGEPDVPDYAFAKYPAEPEQAQPKPEQDRRVKAEPAPAPALSAPRAKPAGVPVTLYWHMADDADVYLNGQPLRDYSPSFQSRGDEAPRPAFSTSAVLSSGDVFTVGGRRGGSYGFMLIAADASGRVVFMSDSQAWKAYTPGDRPDWFNPSAALDSPTKPVSVQADPWYPQKELNAKFQNKALSIWDSPAERFAHLYGVVTLDEAALRAPGTQSGE